MKKTILALSIFLLLSANSFSQTVSPLDYEKAPAVKTISKTNLTKEKINILNEDLRVQNYSNFFETLSATNKNEDYINYLLGKSSEGQPPVYWLMADYYASVDNGKETHKWYYIAIIMSQQDSALCLDLTARFTAQKIMKKFPDALTVIRGTPQFINPAMKEVIFFMESLKQRANPVWACAYGDNDYLYPKEKVINQNMWNEKRTEILNKFASNFGK